MPSTDALSLSIEGGTAAVDPVEWDRMAARCGVYSSAAWLSAWENLAASPPTIVAVKDSHGTVLAATPCFRVHSGEGNPRYDPGVVFAALHGHSAPPGDQLVAGGKAGYVGGILVHDHLEAPERRRALQLLLRGVDDLAAQWGCRRSALMYLDRSLVAELSALDTSKAALATTVSTQIPVAWADFEGYLASLSTSRRSNARRDIRRFEAGGYEIRVDRLAPWVERVAPLLANVQGQHGFDDSVEGAAGYLRLCASKELNDYSVIFLAVRGERVDGFALAYDFGGALSMRVVGLDYEPSEANGVYFSVYFYAPIRHALTRGLRVIDLGLEAYEGKLRKGGQARVLWSLLGDSRLEGPARARAHENRWNAQQEQAWAGQLAGLPGLPAAEEWDAPLPGRG